MSGERPTATSNYAHVGYGIRQCRGHWHVTHGGEDLNSGDIAPQYATMEEAWAVVERLSGNAPRRQMTAPNASPQPETLPEGMEKLIMLFGAACRQVGRSMGCSGIQDEAESFRTLRSAILDLVRRLETAEQPDGPYSVRQCRGTHWHVVSGDFDVSGAMGEGEARLEATNRNIEYRADYKRRAEDAEVARDFNKGEADELRELAATHYAEVSRLTAENADLVRQRNEWMDQYAAEDAEGDRLSSRVRELEEALRRQRPEHPLLSPHLNRDRQ